MKIGLVGAVLNNENLGCVALTYSLMKKLTEIDSNNEFIIFEPKPNIENVKLMKQKLSIPNVNVELEKTNFGRRNLFKSWISERRFVKRIKECSLIIDISEGDSYSDIYGSRRFKGVNRSKFLCEKHRIPIVLAPQTYGPFTNERNELAAKKVISAADLVIARDSISKKYLEDIGINNVCLSTDLAFFLPFDNKKNIISNKLKVGINISGLLWNDSFESSTQKDFKLKVNYQELMKNITHSLISEGYEVHLIPHVSNADLSAIKELVKDVKNTRIAGPFSTPIDAKNYISQMDVFIGSRMHATIASYSSDVATISLSYSRKFSGLFESLGYYHDISLKDLTTNEVFELTMRKVSDYKMLTSEILAHKEELKEKKKALDTLLSDFIKS